MAPSLGLSSSVTFSVRPPQSHLNLQPPPHGPSPAFLLYFSLEPFPHLTDYTFKTAYCHQKGQLQERCTPGA